jgi:flagellin
MATAISGGSRIRTNTPAENAYNSLQASSKDISLRQLRLSTGKRINTAADDVSGYITSRAMSSRNGALKSALQSVGDALNVTSISSDALDNINSLLTQIKDSTSTASSGALGSDERIALAKGAYRLAQQIQFVVDSTVFGGKQLLQGGFTGSWITGFYASNDTMSISINLQTTNVDFNTSSIRPDGTKEVTNNFNLNTTSSSTASNISNFAGVSGLNLELLNDVGNIVEGKMSMGIFSEDNISSTLSSMAEALNNISKVASYIGGIQVRLNSQDELLKSQITNYNAAISRIEDADIATEQLDHVKSQFLQATSLISLAQANQTPSTFLQLFS